VEEAILDAVIAFESTKPHIYFPAILSYEYIIVGWLAGSRAAKKYSKLETQTMSGLTGAKLAAFDPFPLKRRIVCQS
jgi:hypothetical protein